MHVCVCADASSHCASCVFDPKNLFPPDSLVIISLSLSGCREKESERDSCCSERLPRRLLIRRHTHSHSPSVQSPSLLSKAGGERGGCCPSLFILLSLHFSLSLSSPASDLMLLISIKLSLSHSRQLSMRLSVSQGDGRRHASASFALSSLSLALQSFLAFVASHGDSRGEEGESGGRSGRQTMHPPV